MLIYQRVSARVYVNLLEVTWGIFPLNQSIDTYNSWEKTPLQGEFSNFGAMVMSHNFG